MVAFNLGTTEKHLKRGEMKPDSISLALRIILWERLFLLTRKKLLSNFSM